MDISVITYSVFIPLLNELHTLLKTIGLNSLGWSIVFLTAIVKLILTPLTFKQIKSTKKMQVVQPKLKKLQEDIKKKEEKFKDNPEKLKDIRLGFQQEMMSFYKDNKINPLGGCLPLLVQMPILIGLFWTFSGTPFKDQPIFMDVKVVKAADAHKKEVKASTKAEIYVNAEGKRARIALNSKSVTLLEGEEFIIQPTKLMGDAEFDNSLIKWGFFGDKKENEYVSLETLADGTAKVIAVKAGGTAKVQAYLPASQQPESFFFIKDFGTTGVYDVKKGTVNFDVLILVALFGFSVWLSSYLNAPKFPDDPKKIEEDPQLMMQKTMTSMMPVMMTGMMFFIPLPAGALLYMIVSGFIQSGQTYYAMKHYDKKLTEQAS